ncbi:sigma-54-dependent Fis family transcriptional regulator [Desulfotomaculum copahuensis]|uniref:sigma-54-dependent Fis family transcriptional regulator n=1 Tax=Desulfotomaculum copahuensis TaxID=1838280 RepID=UPI001FA7D6DB|nr:sigma-54-dependent Fis family transcriptional regulator [Desulfotomaculum copahuensis]
MLDGCNLPEAIVESWERCAREKVNPADGCSRLILEQRQLQDLQEENRQLITIARPFMQKIYRFVAGSRFIVVLTDGRGCVMERFGDAGVLDEAAAINFVPGACWSEEQVGTNAMGTALKVGKPVQVAGPEHFCLKHHPWTCSAAPIFDQQGRVTGTLDLSGPVEATHQHTLGMVVAAAEAIAMQMHTWQLNNELTVLNKHLINIFHGITDGVLIINRLGKIIDLNPAGERMLGKRLEEMAGRPVQSFFGCERGGQALQHLSGEEELVFHHGRLPQYFRALGEPVTDVRGKLLGTIIILRPVGGKVQILKPAVERNKPFTFEAITGKSKAIRKTLAQASLVAATAANVLLLGETGTGKELLARAIHNHSRRRGDPFVAVNCGAIPRELAGSELFGYEGGAFTGARRDGQPGKFELASGGTIFLDEIGEMPLEQQVVLLRILEEKMVTRVGGIRAIPVDVRVICATNKNLLEEVEKGAFRRDLYYRLNVISIVIPPLRDRPGDIMLLFEHFLAAKGRELQVTFKVAPEIKEYLQKYDWPGNVRELQNVVERMTTLATGGAIGTAHLPAEIYNYLRSAVCRPVSEAALNRRQRKEEAAEQEKRKILLTLNKNGGNVSRTAGELSFSRSTLYRKMRRYGITN